MWNGTPALEGIEPGDLLMAVGELKAKGCTMGTVIDALRGIPGEARMLTLERTGRVIRVNAMVEHLLGGAANVATEASQ